MNWIDEIVAEAAKTFALAARITFTLFWWLALALVLLGIFLVHGARRGIPRVL